MIEIGMKLPYNLSYYQRQLDYNRFNLVETRGIHDVYYSNKNVRGLTEVEMNSACVRLRTVSKNLEYSYDMSQECVDEQSRLLHAGYRKICEIVALQCLYSRSDKLCRLRLEQIQNLGLLVYYNNPSLAGLPKLTQRDRLIDELNDYGFYFNHSDLGVDKLRTFYYGFETYSLIQGKE